MSAALQTTSPGSVSARGSSHVPELSEQEFSAIASLVVKSSGIQLGAGKTGLVKSRLQKRVRAHGLPDFASYIELVQSESGKDELEELICAISTNVTAFNREPHHFVHFREEVLPDLVTRMTSGAAVRIWSAGCSNGSEPHTIACSVLDACPGVSKYDFKILATDIDKYSLNIGRSGHYSKDMVSKMPEQTLKKWFTATGDGYQVADAARALVSFKALNLMKPWPLKMTYDVVFCRNVLIYFSQDDQSRLFSRFTDQMKENAHFYIGHSERVIGPSSDLLKSIGNTTYIRGKKGSNS